MICSNCGKEVAESVQFCSNCGTKVSRDRPQLDAKKYCANCGKELIPGSGFCPNCGTPITKIPSAPPTSVAREPIITSAPVVEPNTCPNCGTRVNSGVAFCPNCGTPVAKQTSTPPTPVPREPVYASVAQVNACPKCGTRVNNGVAFCSVCGTLISKPKTYVQSGSSAAPIAPPPPGAPIVNQAISLDKSSTGITPKFAGVLCYLFGIISGIVFVIKEKDSRFVKFHAWQSILFSLELIIANVLIAIFAITVNGLIGYLQYIISLYGFIMFIMLMVKAAGGNMYQLPVVGSIAKSLAR